VSCIALRAVITLFVSLAVLLQPVGAWQLSARPYVLGQHRSSPSPVAGSARLVTEQSKMLWPAPPPPPPPPSVFGQLGVITNIITVLGAFLAAYMLIDSRFDMVAASSAEMSKAIALLAATTAATSNEIAQLTAMSKETTAQIAQLTATSRETTAQIAQLTATSKETAAQLTATSNEVTALSNEVTALGNQVHQVETVQVVGLSLLLCFALYTLLAQGAKNKDGAA
jgi:hypothetical protein